MKGSRRSIPAPIPCSGQVFEFLPRRELNGQGAPRVTPTVLSPDAEEFIPRYTPISQVFIQDGETVVRPVSQTNHKKVLSHQAMLYLLLSASRDRRVQENKRLGKAFPGLAKFWDLSPLCKCMSATGNDLLINHFPCFSRPSVNPTRWFPYQHAGSCWSILVWRNIFQGSFVVETSSRVTHLMR